VHVLELKRLNSGYGRSQVLFDFDLQLGAGEVVALLAATAPANPLP
jgi:ABC-type branched-subunit amino acid transport system ATPase component